MQELPGHIGRLVGGQENQGSKPPMMDLPPRERFQFTVAPSAMAPEAFGKYMSDDVVKWERIVKISGAQPDK